MREVFSDYLECNGIAFKHAYGPTTQPGKEFHVYHEILCFLEGSAELISEDIHAEIKPGTLIVIPKERYHRIVIRNDASCYYRSVIRFFDTPELREMISGKLDRIKLIPFTGEVRGLFERLERALREDEQEKHLIFRAVLILLLAEIPKNEAKEENAQEPLVQEILRYVNTHIREDISLALLAKQLNSSVSLISHVFKREMNISLYRFIIKKRLLLAYERILQGEAPTAAALECGFRDYSGFYKQFKKMMGFSPSDCKTVERLK